MKSTGTTSIKMLNEVVVHEVKKLMFDNKERLRSVNRGQGIPQSR